MNSDATWATVESLRNIFAIILALSLNEAFKQIVADQPDPVACRDKKAIRWDSLFALASLMVLLIPFFHGMGRYLFEVYRHPDHRPEPYGWYLLFDVSAFTVEAGLFFVMSRSLNLQQAIRFYCAVILILIVDTVWGTAVYFLHRKSLLPWLVLNFGFLPILGLLVFLGWQKFKRWYACFGVALMMVRTAIDYWSSWSFYFPGKE